MEYSTRAYGVAERESALLLTAAILVCLVNDCISMNYIPFWLRMVLCSTPDSRLYCGTVWCTVSL